MNDISPVRGFHAHALTGSPVGRLRDDTSRRLASGSVPKCPHPDQPVIWYLPAGMLACGSCVEGLVREAGDTGDVCHLCGSPAAAVAAWVTGGVPCVASVCEPCHADGLVPIAPN